MMLTLQIMWMLFAGASCPPVPTVGAADCAGQKIVITVDPGERAGPRVHKKVKAVCASDAAKCEEDDQQPGKKVKVVCRADAAEKDGEAGPGVVKKGTITCRVLADEPTACGKAARIWVQATVPDDKETVVRLPKRVIVRAAPCGELEDEADSDEPGAAGTRRLFVRTVALDDEKGGGQPGDDEETEVKTIVVTEPEAGDIEAGGPWLGIQYGPLPRSLAAHLRLDKGVGQMVLNVTEGSPADETGLDQYDVIFEMDGQDVPGDVAVFLDRVRALKPEETCQLKIVHQGKKKEVEITVGSRPDDAAAGEYKFEPQEEELAGGQIFRRGGLLEKNEDGNWLFKEFDPQDMPDVWKWFPDDEGQTFEFEIAPPPGLPHFDRDEFVWKSEKGKFIRIERGDNGEIKISRTVMKDGKETTTTKTYANEDELKKDDPEAYKMMKDCPGGQLKSLYGGPFKGRPPLPPRAPGAFFPKAFERHVEEALRGVHEEAPAKLHEDALKLYEQALKHAEELRAQKGEEAQRLAEEAQRLAEEARKLSKGLPKDVQVLRDDLRKRFETELGRDLSKQMKPRTSFEVLADGKLRVTQREGDDELVWVFDNAAALKAKRPELYEKFARLRKGEAKNPTD